MNLYQPLNLFSSRIIIYIKRTWYKIVYQFWFINLLSWTYKCILLFSCETIAKKLIYKITALITLNIQSVPGTVHPHHLRLYWRVLHHAHRKEVTPCRPPAEKRHFPLRIGLYGYLSVTLLTQKPLFCNLPDDIWLYIFDMRHPDEYREYTAQYLKDLVHYYELFDDNPLSVNKMINAINASELDLVININYNLQSFLIIDQLDTPCIVHLCSGTDLFHHDKIAFHLHAQPQSDYFIKNGHLFSTATHSYFNNQLVFPIGAVYDTRDLLSEEAPSWKEREPLIFWHGSLYKFASAPFLEILMRLMSDDKDLYLVFAGRDDQSRKKGMKDIIPVFKKWKVTERAHYLGRLIYGRNERGEMEGDWREVKENLKKARLWPDTFPMGGGTARAEAYAAGTPTVHMGVSFEERLWNRKQWSQVELPALLLPQNTAYTLDDYQKLCQESLYNQNYATNIINNQRILISRYSDGREFWLRVIEAYQRWYNGQEGYKNFNLSHC